MSLKKIGLTISAKNLVPPSTVITCLGVQINTIEGTISGPPEKLQKIREMCLQWENKIHTNKRHLQSLLGSLLHIAKCVKSSRDF